VIAQSRKRQNEVTINQKFHYHSRENGNIPLRGFGWGGEKKEKFLAAAEILLLSPEKLSSKDT